MASSLPHKNIVKKRTARFIRFKAHQYKRLATTDTWRKPRGIDNPQRRRFGGTAPSPKIGYGSDAKTRNMRPDGFKTYLVNNVKDVEVLLMHNRTYAAEIAHNVSSQKRIAIIKRATELDVKVTNPHARVRSQERE